MNETQKVGTKSILVKAYLCECCFRIVVYDFCIKAVAKCVPPYQKRGRQILKPSKRGT